MAGMNFFSHGSQGSFIFVSSLCSPESLLLVRHLDRSNRARTDLLSSLRRLVPDDYAANEGVLAVLFKFGDDYRKSGSDHGGITRWSLFADYRTTCCYDRVLVRSFLVFDFWVI